MEHVTIKELAHGYKQLTPDNGYTLSFQGRTYSEAVVQDLEGWAAVAQ